MALEGISPDVQKKLADASSDELIQLATENGIDLTDEQLDAISGGSLWDGKTGNYTTNCPACGKTIIWPMSQPDPNSCPYCGVTLNFKQ